MKRSLFFVSSAVSILAIISSCGPSTSDALVGAWVEPIPGMEGTQGMVLSADGSARSVRMATLRYDRWSLRDGEFLLLEGESLGNGSSSRFVDTLRLLRVDADSLILSRGGLRIAFGRATDAPSRP